MRDPPSTGWPGDRTLHGRVGLRGDLRQQRERPDGRPTWGRVRREPVDDVDREGVQGEPPVPGAQWDEVHDRWEHWDEATQAWVVVGRPR